jgi:hypothetical protein
VIGSPVATWISRAAADRHERKNSRHPRAVRASFAIKLKSLSSSVTSTAVAAMDTASAHAFTTSTASTTCNA